MFDVLFVSLVSLDFCGIFGKSKIFHFIALYCVLFWENRKLPLCCRVILCVFLCGDLLGDTILSLWITVEYFGKSENFHSIALYCVLFLGKPNTSTLLWIHTLCTLLWLQQLHQKSVCLGY